MMNVVKKMSCLYMVVFVVCTCISSTIVFASDVGKSDDVQMVVTPEEGDVINGIDESKHPSIQPRDVIAGPYFYSFKPNTKTHKNNQHM